MAASVGGSTVVGPSPSRNTGWLFAVVRAVDVVLGRPSLWPIALAGFLARGGFVLLLVPILPVPTAVGLANIIGPTAVTAGGLAPDTVVLVVVVGVATIVWFVAGGIVGAAVDIALADATRDDDDPKPADLAGRGTAGLVARLVGIRLVALIPLALAITLTGRPIFDALYRQLTAPSQVAEPLLVRIAMDAAGPLAIVVLGWLIGELIGGIAVRLAILADLSVGRSVVGAVIHIARRPITFLATAVLGSAGLVLTLGPSLIASGIAWSRLHGYATGAPTTIGHVDVIVRNDLAFLLASVVIVATWLGTLVFAAVGSAWRGLLWSTEIERAVRSRR